MKTHRVGIIMNGVTGRMGANQHLKRSIAAIRAQGGVKINDNEIIMPDPILVGRNENKLRALSEQTGIEKISTDPDACLADPAFDVYFDAQTTSRRVEAVGKAIDAGKAIYCEKPTAENLEDAVHLAKKARKAGVKNGVVQDKLWLPGLRKLKMLIDRGFFGKILSVRGEFGYWVFTGHDTDQAPQRPSWNYRKESGGGIIVDMHCHWRYVIDNLFGNVTSVFCHAATHVPERIDEAGQPYVCTADDSAYALFKTDQDVICQFNSSWCVRVRRDDLFTMQVDGTDGSALVGLRKCWIQPHVATPRPIWNPDIDNPIDFYDGWQEVPDAGEYDNAFKIQWEMFLRHIVLDEPFKWDLMEAAKGVQLAEKSLEASETGAWVDVGELV